MLKTLALTTVSVAALTAANPSALAADIYSPQPMAEQKGMHGISAILSFWGGAGFLSSSDTNFDQDFIGSFGGNARAAAQNWQVELVASAHTGTSSASSSDDPEPSAHVALGAHRLYRGADMTRGHFLAISQTNHSETSDASTHVFGGGEWAHFRGNRTYFVQAGLAGAIYGQVSSTFGYGAFGRVGMRHFVTDDRKWEFDLLGMIGKEGGGGSGTGSGNTLTAFNWSVEHEKRMNGGPWARALFYRGHYVNDSGDSTPSATDHSLGVEFSLDIGAGSLLYRDRYGAATFDLPDLHRAFGWVDKL